MVARLVTVYRQWSFLEKWVEDMALREPGVEWLIFNDAPDDPCPDSMRSSLERLGARILGGRFNVGRSEARNILARNSTAPFIEFVDGDDLPRPLGDLGTLVDDADLLSFPIQTYRLKGAEIELGAVERSPGFACPGLFRSLSEVSPLPASLLYRRAIFEESGGFDGRFDLIEDLHLLWKLDKLGARAKFATKPKQRYFMTSTAERCDGYLRPLHWIRFFRHAEAFAEQNGESTGAIRQLTETSEVNTIQVLLRDLAHRERGAKSSSPSSMGPSVQVLTKDLEWEAKVIFWQARQLWGACSNPGLTSRLREALKVALNRF